jgi:hypothetical protein
MVLAPPAYPIDPVVAVMGKRDAKRRAAVLNAAKVLPGSFSG